MEKLITELEKIYEKLGGTASDIPPDHRTDLEFIVDKIEDKVGNGGGGGGSDSPLYMINDYTLYKLVDESWVVVKYGEIANKMIMATFDTTPGVFVCADYGDACDFHGYVSAFTGSEACISDIVGHGNADDNIVVQVTTKTWVVENPNSTPVQ